jgi:hypothetical protein
MKTAKNIIGFLVLDEGKPVRNTPSWYANWDSRYPVAVFASRKVAARVLRLLRDSYFAQASKMQPEPNATPARKADIERCFQLWKKRAETVCIRRVQAHNPSVEAVRAFRREVC